MAAPTTPPDYAFRHVMEYPGPLNPSIGKVLAGLYVEPQRTTRDIFLLGRRRPLVFLTELTSRNRAFKLKWKDRTAAFFKEWVRAEDGTWSRVSVEEPPPIRDPGPPAAKRPPVEDPLELPVKELAKKLADGALDAEVATLFEREKAGDNPTAKPRAGAIAALAARLGVLRASPGSAPPSGDSVTGGVQKPAETAADAAGTPSATADESNIAHDASTPPAPASAP